MTRRQFTLCSLVAGGILSCLSFFTINQAFGATNIPTTASCHRLHGVSGGCNPANLDLTIGAGTHIGGGIWTHSITLHTGAATCGAGTVLATGTLSWDTNFCRGCFCIGASTYGNILGTGFMCAGQAFNFQVNIVSTTSCSATQPCFGAATAAYYF